MKNDWLLFSTLNGILLFARICFAQNLPVERYEIEDGLPSNWITVVFQDSRGYLWTGGDGGFSIYDGVEFRTYSFLDSLPVGMVWTIAESPSKPGKIYIGTHGRGLIIYEDGRFRTQELSDSLPQNVVDAILEDSEGTLWCGTTNGVIRVKNDSTSYFPTGGGIRHWVPFIKQTSDSLIWISHDSSLFIYTPGSGEIDKLDLGNPKTQYYAMLEDDEGDIWIGTYDGEVLRIRQYEIVATRQLNTGEITSLIDDGEGYLWIISDGGLVKINKQDFPEGRPMTYTTENGLPQHPISGFIDREKNLWFGTRNQGIFKLSELHIFSFALPSIGGAWPGSNAELDSHGHLFVCSKLGIWEVWQEADGFWQTFLHDLESLNAENAIQALDFSPDGTLWASSSEGTTRGYRLTATDSSMRLNLFKTLTVGKELPDGGRFGGFIIDRNNQLWYNRTDGYGTAQIDLNTFDRIHMYTKNNGLLAGTVLVIHLDQKGDIWFGEFRGGIAIFKPDGKKYVPDRTLTKEDGLGDDRIRAIIERTNGDIWIGHRYNGITIYRDGQIERLTTQDGLKHNAVWSLFDDYAGRVWVGTSVGLQYIEPERNREFQTHRRLTGRLYTALGMIPGDNILFGVSMEELTLYDYRHKYPLNVAPPIYITGLRVDGQDKPMKDGQEFTHDENFCVIKFNGLSFRNEKELCYRYRLKGLNRRWQGPTTQQEVTFASLQPGSYTFEVKAISADGIESSKPAALTFVILPPVWQRWWFLTISGLLLGCLIYSWHRLRLKRLLQIERIRSRIATDLHDDIGAGLTHIGLLSEIALRKTGLQAGDGNGKKKDALSEEQIHELGSSMARVGEVARELSSAMSDVVWSINPKHDSVGALQHRLRAFAYEICQAKGVNLDFSVSPRIANLQLDPEVRRNLLLIAKEALHNMAKYSASPSVKIKIDADEKDIHVEIEDVGQGFEFDRLTHVNGLTNMRNRAEKVGGMCHIESAAGKGTRVTASVPLNN